MKKLQKPILFLLTLCLLSALLVPAVSATEDSPVPFVEWTVSENGLEISGDEKTYTFVAVERDYRAKIEPWIYNVYRYENKATVNGKQYSVYAMHKGAEFLVLRSTPSSYMLYATEAGKALIADLADGKPPRYALCERRNKERNTNLDAATVTKLLQSVVQPARTYNVQDLNDLDSYTLYALDESGSACYIAGRFYKLSDEVYGYVNHLKLDNTHFDADGSFSYRSGSVEVTLLNRTDGKELLESAVRSIRHNAPEVVYEGEEAYAVDGEEERLFSHEAFLVMYVLLGFVLPVAPIAVGRALGLSKKRGTHYWLILAGVGLLWALLALALLLLLLSLGA